MDAELERFRQEVARLQAGKVRSSVRYPEALRAFAVRYVTEAMERGESRVKAAARLGISEPTLGAWLRGAPWRRKGSTTGAPKGGSGWCRWPCVRSRHEARWARTYALVGWQWWRRRAGEWRG